MGLFSLPLKGASQAPPTSRLASTEKPGICVLAMCSFSLPGWKRPWAEGLVVLTVTKMESSWTHPVPAFPRISSRGRASATPHHPPSFPSQDTLTNPGLLPSCLSLQPTLPRRPSLLWPLFLLPHFTPLLCSRPPPGAEGARVGPATRAAGGSSGGIRKPVLGQR